MTRRGGGERTEGGGTMLARLAKAAALAAIVVAVVRSLPDLKRYLEIRSM